MTPVTRQVAQPIDSQGGKCACRHCAVSLAPRLHGRANHRAQDRSIGAASGAGEGPSTIREWRAMADALQSSIDAILQKVTSGSPSVAGVVAVAPDRDGHNKEGGARTPRHRGGTRRRDGR